MPRQELQGACLPTSRCPLCEEQRCGPRRCSSKASLLQAPASIQQAPVHSVHLAPAQPRASAMSVTNALGSILFAKRAPRGLQEGSLLSGIAGWPLKCSIHSPGQAYGTLSDVPSAGGHEEEAELHGRRVQRPRGRHEGAPEVARQGQRTPIRVRRDRAEPERTQLTGMGSSWARAGLDEGSNMAGQKAGHRANSGTAHKRVTG